MTRRSTRRQRNRRFTSTMIMVGVARRGIPMTPTLQSTVALDVGHELLTAAVIVAEDAAHM